MVDMSTKSIMFQKVAAKLNTLGPGKCVAIPADLQKVDDIKKIVTELSKYEDRK